MWDRLFLDFLDKIFRLGRLTVITADGKVHGFGDGTGAPSVTVRLLEADLPRRIVLNPDLAVGEAYMDGRLLIEGDALHDFFALVLTNLTRRQLTWWQAPIRLSQQALRGVAQHNPISRAQSNVAHHYDLSGELYDLFLDEDRQYSCAYFPDPDMTLEQAQAAKKAHVAKKLLLEPGMSVLDIGCGWGGTALTLARDFGVTVVGVTLSTEQHALAVKRAEEAGLSDRVEFRLSDYRAVTGTFDRIVSVGMFEHVGAPHYREYFRTIERLLTPDGVALVHTIGRQTPPGYTSAFIRKHIFPGGYIPALSEIAAALEDTALWTTDIEVWRLHYALTLRHWHDRFMARQDRARDLYDDRFVRMWRYYLVASEMSFRHDRRCVFQIQLSRRQDAVPLVRDYMCGPGPAGRGDRSDTA